jgi:hypothetical protein
MSIQLEEKRLEVGGKTYVLHANMSVLDRVVDEHDGDVAKFLATPKNDAMAEILAAMLNDWAEDQDWDQEWTTRKVKKYFSVAMLLDLDVLGMFFRAMTPPNAGKAKSNPERDKNTDPENSGN